MVVVVVVFVTTVVFMTLVLEPLVKVVLIIVVVSIFLRIEVATFGALLAFVVFLRVLVVVLFFFAFEDNFTFLVVVFLVCDTFVFTVSKAFAFTLAGVIAKQQIPRSTAVTVKILLNFPFIFNPSNFAL